MNQKELKELIDFLIERDIAEFELERGDVKVRVKRGANAQVHAVAHHVAQMAPLTAAGPSVPIAIPATPPAAPAPPTASPEAQPAPEEDLHTVKSPIVGTFYKSPA